MSESFKSNIKFTLILLVLIALTGVGISLAYFAANVTQSASSKVEVHAVEGLAINYDNGSVINIGNFIPGSSTKKTFSATLTNKKLAFSVTYNVMMKITTNGFDTNAGELTYSLKKNNAVVASGTISGTGTKTLLANSTITGNTSSYTTTDSFELTITYPNLNREQTQGAAFSGSVYFGTGTNQIDANSVQESSQSEPTLISFTIAGTTYQAEDGMTWGEWIDSSYSNYDFIQYCVDGIYKIGTDKGIILPNIWQEVRYNEKIECLDYRLINNPC